MDHPRLINSIRIASFSAESKGKIGSILKQWNLNSSLLRRGNNTALASQGGCRFAPCRRRSLVSDRSTAQDALNWFVHRGYSFGWKALEEPSTVLVRTSGANYKRGDEANGLRGRIIAR